MEYDKISMLYDLENQRIEEYRKRAVEEYKNSIPFANNEKVYLPDIHKYNRLVESPLTVDEYKLFKRPDWKPPSRNSDRKEVKSLRANEEYSNPPSRLSFRNESPNSVK